MPLRVHITVPLEIDNSEDKPIWASTRKGIYIATAYADYLVDASSIEVSAIDQENFSARITIPRPTLGPVYIDDNTRQVYANSSLRKDSNATKEYEIKIENKAESAVKDIASQNLYKARAMQHCESVLTKFYLAAGWNVEVEWQED